MLPAMSLNDDLERVARLADLHADTGEQVTGVLASEPRAGVRVYVCAFERDDGGRAWLALDDDGEAVQDRGVVRDAVSIAAMCETAVEVAAGGNLEELRSTLLTLRLSENPPGIEEAEEAALALERTLGVPPRLASPAYLDEVGGMTRRLEHALGEDGVSPFAEAMKAAMGAIESLVGEVDANYKRGRRARPT